jgi:hypothetical protein
MPPNRNVHNFTNNNNNQNIAEIIMSLIPDIANQVAAAMNNNNVNNNNNNNRGNNNNRYTYQQSMTYEPMGFDGKKGTIRITKWTEKVETMIDVSNGAKDDNGALIDEMARKGKSTKDSEKRKNDAESSRRENNKKARANKNNNGDKYIMI